MKIWVKIVIVLFTILLSTLLNTDLSVYIISAILILLFGIPHGATDHILYNFNEGRSKRNRISMRFLIQYIGLIVIYSLMWWQFPAFSLVFFLIISAFHFGETQFKSIKGSISLKNFLQFSWGILVLFLLFSIHMDLVKVWLLPLTGYEVVYNFLEDYHFSISMMLLGAVISSLLILERKVIKKELLELALLYILFFNTHLILGFAVFFAFWHSQDAIALQLKGLHQKENPFRIREFIKAALPYTILSMIGLTILTLVLYDYQSTISWVIIFFVGIALLTLPHSIIINQFYKKIE